MADSITISRTPPDFQSMQYDLLRSEGLRHIQELAGKIWTDYNLSDPGISILEVLSYAITDLGYRTNYQIKDILAQDPDAPQVDIKNFYSARQILPMNPVTFNDYRKLLIDVDVHDPSDIGAEFVGVKNAWIDISPVNEIPVYIQRALEKLDYTPEIPTSPEKVDINVLYNVLLELDRCDKFGDMNENTLERTITIVGSTPFPEFSGMKVIVNVEFPRWDDPDVDWNDIASIRAHIKKLTLVFSRIPQGYTLEGYGLFPDKSVWVSIMQFPGGPLINTAFLEAQIYQEIYLGSNSLILLYQEKVKKILQIITAVRKRLMANRNLCEDIFKITALKIEEIAVCADIEIETNADVEETLAQIYFAIENFLDPTVYFYTLDEMYAKGKRTEEIFEGPALNHGFIDSDELKKADRRKVIHVSDLINIIMDVPGVLAVKSIQIANIPEDNDDNIPSVTVKWCLDLAFEFNYVPRLTTDLSKITFFKDQLPYKADAIEVAQLLVELEDAARPQKIENAVLDLPVPQGEYKNIEEYVSTQDEFPLVYGIGPEGLPESSTTLRKAQAQQLKGFLMFFDQLLADFLSQLAHVKDLFSMNEERDAFGDFVIDKSYFTQSLVPSVTGATALLVDPVFYPEHVQDITEDVTLFELRRNKFLDHLMARFSEQFTDYALVEYKLEGKKAPHDLLVDKLEVLNAYPAISSGRFKAFDYESPCELWSVDNVSGLEKRVDLLTGVDPRTPADLFFHARFKMTNVIPTLEFEIYDNDTFSNILLRSASVYKTVDDWKLGIEEVIVNGVNRERYDILDNAGNPIGPDNPATPTNGPYKFRLTCDAGNLLGLSPLAVTYLTITDAENAIDAAIVVLSNEFYFNIESNRNNLSCALRDYIDISPELPFPNMVPDPPTYTYDFTLYKNPFDFSATNVKLMTGSYTGCGQAKASVGITTIISSNTIRVSGDFTDRIHPGDAVSIKNSFSNDGDYNVVSRTVVGTETEFVLGGITPVPAFLPNIPLGTLFYNTQTAAQLQAIANAGINSTLFNIMFNGSLDNHYTYDSLSGSYRFNIGDKCGNTLATSVENNFNNAMAAITALHPGTSMLVPPFVPPLSASTKIRITGNAIISNNGDYVVTTATAINESIKVNVPDSLTNTAGGNLLFDGSFSVTSVDLFTRTFVVNAILNRVLLPGETINIINSFRNDGVYTIKNVIINGTNSEIKVVEKIHDNTGSLGELYYSKNFFITSIQPALVGTDIFFKPGAEVVAANEMADFIRLKFFGHEGMHIVEHVLLRPKVNGDFLIPMVSGVNSLTPLLTPPGNIELTKTFQIASVNGPFNMFFINQDITLDLTPMMFITVKGSAAGINDKTYQVVSFGTTGTDTGIKVVE
ncbi:MAG: hypothetical protein ACXVDW_11400, partial [Bacteroidia bacterium]